MCLSLMHSLVHWHFKNMYHRCCQNLNILITYLSYDWILLAKNFGKKIPSLLLFQKITLIVYIYCIYFLKLKNKDSHDLEKLSVCCSLLFLQIVDNQSFWKLVKMKFNLQKSVYWRSILREFDTVLYIFRWDFKSLRRLCPSISGFRVTVKR